MTNENQSGDLIKLIYGKKINYGKEMKNQSRGFCKVNL